jgi:hypothetical protein
MWDPCRVAHQSHNGVGRAGKLDRLLPLRSVTLWCFGARETLNCDFEVIRIVPCTVKERIFGRSAVLTAVSCDM